MGFVNELVSDPRYAVFMKKMRLPKTGNNRLIMEGLRKISEAKP